MFVVQPLRKDSTDLLFQEYRIELGNYVVDQVPLMKSAQDSNSPILIEGANALMLDLDFGTYPYVTSVSISFVDQLLCC